MVFPPFPLLKGWVRSVSYTPGTLELTGRSLEQMVVQRDQIPHSSNYFSS